MSGTQIPCPTPQRCGVKSHLAGSRAARACARIAARRSALQENQSSTETLQVPSAVPQSESTVVRQTRAAAEHLIYETLEGLEWGAMTRSQTVTELVYRGVRHPDYVGSKGTAPALDRDLVGLSGIPTSGRYARHLAKRGWYVDQDSKSEFIRVPAPVDPQRHLDDLLALAPVFSEALVDSIEPYSDRTDWDAMPEVLIATGVTHPDFEGRDVDPTPALERDLDDLRGKYGERRDWDSTRDEYIKDLSERGWTARGAE